MLTNEVKLNFNHGHAHNSSEKHVLNVLQHMVYGKTSRSNIGRLLIIGRPFYEYVLIYA